MNKGHLWISDGKLIEIDPAIVKRRGLSRFLREERLVLVTVGEAGTAVRWHLAHASWTSLYALINQLKICPGPFQLNFFIEGWVSETYFRAKDASRRIDELIGKSDARLSKKAYVFEKELDRRDMPQLLQLALAEHEALTDHRVDTVFHEIKNMFYLERAGESSLLSKIMGENWTETFAGKEELADSDFDYEVMSHYEQVLQRGKPRYDQVFATVTPPGGDPIWASYKRLIVPTRFENGRIGVSSFCQTAELENSLL